MLRNLLLTAILAACLGSYAQEPLKPLLPEKDSSIMAAERQIMYHKLLSGFLPGTLTEPLQLPEFDFQSELNKRWESGISHNAFNYWSFGSWLPGFAGLAGSPFLRDETVFGGSAFHLNDRFTVGGYSFGAKSLFSAPFPNQGFDVRGSSLFLQYKVSKNVKIETRVNVTQAPGF